jgi:bifunctional non-homologous end joining protein LigD
MKTKATSKKPVKNNNRNTVKAIVLKKRPSVKASAKKGTASLNGKSISKDLLEAAPAGKFPSGLTPMLATLVDKPFDQAGWLYEVKWDGYRALAFLNKGKVELKSRNNKSFNEKFYPITQALSRWKINAVIDGEIVVVGENGISNFGDLQNWRSEADGELLFYVFDILWYEGKKLTDLPLMDRKAILKDVLPKDELIKVSDYFLETGTTFYETAKKIGLEGIIAKKANSVYYPGDRSKEWLKIKANKRQEMVIGGFTINEGTSKLFSALLVGVYDGKRLHYTGKIGTGFNDKTQQEMMKAFKPLITSKVPFTEIPDVNKPSRFRPNPPHAAVTWLKPELVCEVSYAELTSEGIMRHPSFEGMRMDKKATEVIKETEKPTEKIVKETKAATEKIIPKRGKLERKTLLNPTEDTQVKIVNGHELKFTHLNKYYWPKEKITKRDLINYYYQVAPYILPYLKDRPQSMLRHPDGINGFSFYYKNVKGKAPEWVETYDYHSEGDGEDKEYLVAKDDASLLYMASLGCIEMNPWSSTVQKEDYPDWCIIDLDPAKNTFDQVVETAQVTRQVLESLGVPGYPKTSGSTGMHIYIPLGAKYTYEQSKEFARIVARLVHEQLPKFTSIERIVKDRKGKMYIDFLQNRPQATISAPYSVRPKPGATVSMPLHWDEVKKGLKMTDFTIHNALDRIKSEGDIFKPVLGKGINLEKVIRNYTKELEAV